MIRVNLEKIMSVIGRLLIVRHSRDLRLYSLTLTCTGRKTVDTFFNSDKRLLIWSHKNFIAIGRTAKKYHKGTVAI